MKGSTAETARKRPERPWTAARTMEVLRRCPLAIAQRLVHCAIALSTAVLDRVDVGPLCRRPYSCRGGSSLNEPKGCDQYAVSWFDVSINVYLFNLAPSLVYSHMSLRLQTPTTLKSVIAVDILQIGVTSTRWQKWLMETGQTVTVTGQIHYHFYSYCH